MLIFLVSWPALGALLASGLCWIASKRPPKPPIGRFVNIDGVWYPRAHVDAMDLRRPPADR
jgi:hypothetical protein